MSEYKDNQLFKLEAKLELIKAKMKVLSKAKSVFEAFDLCTSYDYDLPTSKVLRKSQTKLNKKKELIEKKIKAVESVKLKS